MELGVLEGLLGIRYERDEERKRVILPADRWSHVYERVDSVGCTRLMIASRDGVWECVNLLLRCGADVNAHDRRKRKAIDYSVGGNHLEVTLMLLQWDSLLPYQTEKSGELKDVLFQYDDIRKFFTDRDAFHQRMEYDKPESLKKYLRSIEGTNNAPRYWVNSEGESALYTAAKQSYYDAWALLKSSGFVCGTEDEEDHVKLCEEDDAFSRAIGNYFVEIRGCHVQKMVAKSKVYSREGLDNVWCGEKVDSYFKEIDRVEYTSDLLQCLQDDHTLEIVFDFSSTEIQCMKPLGNSVKEAWGLVDFQLNRIYVGAMETEEFGYSCLVSNITHELAHKTLEIVFQNGGLPYCFKDTDMQEEYENAIRNTISNQHHRKLDNILVRALKSQDRDHELIVRVPEMIIKYYIQCTENNNAENGFIRLQHEAPDLLEFYMSRVVPKIKDYIKSNITANKAVKSELLRTPSLLTAYHNERIQVIDTIDKVCTSKQKVLRIFKMSNLKLGVSHLMSSIKEISCVDWTKYQSAQEYFNNALDRNEIKTLAIIWDEPIKPYFCCKSNSTCSGYDNCIAKKLKYIVDVTILIIPKKFNVRFREDSSFGYIWKDLSSSTKDWIMEKKLYFKGKWMPLRDIVGCINGNSDPGHFLDELLDEDDLSMLIDQDNVRIGRPLTSLMKGSRDELLCKNPECYIPRSLRVRHIEFNKYVFYSRISDVFFIMNAEISDLLKDGIKEVCIWDGNNVPVGIRCFIIIGHQYQENIDDAIQEIINKFIDLACQEFKRGKLDFSHFFELKKNKYIHLNSLHCKAHRNLSKSIAQRDMFHYSGSNILECSELGSTLIISDTPGSGKSVYVKNTAIQMMKDNSNRWVDFVELQLFENVFKEWIKTDLRSEEKEMNCLYDIINVGGTGRERNFERKLFNCFYKTKKRYVIFFDGMDEICPSYKEIFTSFLEAVVSKSSVNVCITTREHESADLEKRLANISFRFQPFSTEDQVKYISMHWDALLNSLPNGERESKIQDIVSHLESQDKLADKMEILKPIQNPTMKEVGSGIVREVNFEVLAAELLKVGRSMVEGEGDFTSTPLHTWMLSTVSFEENLNLSKYIFLPDLYSKFIEIKISLYCEEKAKLSGNVASDSMLAGVKLSVNKNLKKFSSSFFLQTEECKLNQDEIHHMLRVGLLAQRDQSVIFVHRTFGEYLFSLWLLEKAHKEKVTRVLMSSVLVESKYEKVRQFLDSLLLSEYGKKAARVEKERVELGKYLLNPSAFSAGEQFVNSMQKCMFKSIVECTEGILRYLTESSKMEFADVIFGGADWDIEALDINIGRSCKITHWNAFDLCGECIGGVVRMTDSNVRHSQMEYLKFLPKMLQLVEEHGLVANLKEFMSIRGLNWLGVNVSYLWMEGEGRVEFRCIFEFLFRNKNVMGETLKAKLLYEERNIVFTNSAIHAFDLFVFIVESFFEEDELKESLLERRKFVRAWTCVVEKCGLEGVKKMWGFLGGKLKTNEERRRFIQKKDFEEKNALFAAFVEFSDANVISFVWELLRKEFDVGSCKELIFDSFQRVQESRSEFNNYAVFHWLFRLLEDGFLDAEEATHFLLSRNHWNQCYMLIFHLSPLPPPSLHRFQELLLTGRLISKDIMKETRWHYMWLFSLCFKISDCISWDADFTSSVDREWEELIPSLESSPLWNAIQLDEDGFLLRVLDDKGNRMHVVRLKAFVVLLERQCRLEEMTLGSEGLLERIKRQWYHIDSYFPWLRLREDEQVKMEVLLVPLFITILSKFLSKQQVGEILLHHNRLYNTAFHIALRREDSSLFLAWYDVARWCFGECALCKVHALQREEDESNKLIVLLLEKQEEGLF